MLAKHKSLSSKIHGEIVYIVYSLKEYVFDFCSNGDNGLYNCLYRFISAKSISTNHALNRTRR